MSKKPRIVESLPKKTNAERFQKEENTMYLKPEDLSTFNVVDVCCGHMVPLRFPLNHVVGHLRADSQTAQAATKVLQSR